MMKDSNTIIIDITAIIRFILVTFLRCNNVPGN